MREIENEAKSPDDTKLTIVEAIEQSKDSLANFQAQIEEFVAD